MRGLAILNADVHTSDPERPRAEAILAVSSRIAAVGSEASVRAKAKREGVSIFDADGRLVVPGIIDSHTHLIHQGLLRRRVDLHGTTSLAQALAMVARALPRAPRNKILLAERWDESQWKERRYPTRDELDNLSGRVPIVLRRVDGHIAVANTRAARMVAKRLDGVDLEQGLLVEAASLNLNQAFPTPTRESSHALEAAQTLALSMGVTTVHDFVVPSYLRAYQRLRKRRRLRIRAHLSLYSEFEAQARRWGAAARQTDDRLRLHGLKLFLDGSLGGHTAALHQPYHDRPHERGLLLWSRAKLRSLAERARRAGLPLSVHAIGDAAIDQALDTLRSSTQSRLPNRIEHFELHPRDAGQRLQERGVVASMQPNFVGTWSRPGGLYADRLGPPRFRRNNEFRNLLRAGTALAFGSDCMPFDPWYGIQSAQRAPYASQRLTWEQALAAYTRGSAQGLGRGDDLGTLAVGKRADLVVLDARRPPGASSRAPRPIQVHSGGQLALQVRQLHLSH